MIPQAIGSVSIEEQKNEPVQNQQPVQEISSFQYFEDPQGNVASTVQSPVKINVDGMTDQFLTWFDEMTEKARVDPTTTGIDFMNVAKYSAMESLKRVSNEINQSFEKHQVKINQQMLETAQLNARLERELTKQREFIKSFKKDNSIYPTVKLRKNGESSSRPQVS